MRAYSAYLIQKIWPECVPTCKDVIVCILRQLDLVTHMVACEALTGRVSPCPEYMFSRTCEQFDEHNLLVKMLLKRVRWWYMIDPCKIGISMAKFIHNRCKYNIGWVRHHIQIGAPWVIEFARATSNTTPHELFIMALNYAPLYIIEELYEPRMLFQECSINMTTHNWRWLCAHGYNTSKSPVSSVLQVLDSLSPVEQDEFVEIVGDIVSLRDIFRVGHGMQWHVCTPKALQMQATEEHISHINALLYLMQCPDFDLIRQECTVAENILMEFVNMDVCPATWRGYLMAYNDGSSNSNFAKLRQKICITTFLRYADSQSIHKAIAAGLL